MPLHTDDSCRSALIDALALLDQHGEHGAACYVAMALDQLDEGRLASPAEEPAPVVVPIHRG